MISDMESVTETVPYRSWSRVHAYVRLAKLDVFDYYLGLLVVFSALAPAERFEPRALATLLIFLLGEVFVVAAMVAFDDLTGYLDGSDVTNYGPDAPARRLARKPLVAGTLNPREVRRFGWVTCVIGAALWSSAAIVAPHRPVWALVVGAVTVIVAVQYSYGVKLSYHGFQEMFLAALGWSLVVVPFGLVHGFAGGFVLVQAFLFGLGPLLFGVYSNTNDIAGDRRVGRPTVAVLTSARGNAIFVAAISALEFVVILGAPFIGLAPWWFPLVMVPTIILRATQYDRGFRRGDILGARRLGIRIHRITVVLLVGLNLVYPLFGGRI